MKDEHFKFNCALLVLIVWSFGIGWFMRGDLIYSALLKQNTIINDTHNMFYAPQVPKGEKQ